MSDATSEKKRQSSSRNGLIVVFVIAAVSVLLLVIAFIVNRRRAASSSSSSSKKNESDTEKPPQTEPAKPEESPTKEEPPNKPEEPKEPVIIPPSSDQPTTSTKQDLSWIPGIGDLEIYNTYGMYSQYGYKLTLEHPYANLGVLISKMRYSMEWEDIILETSVKMTLRMSELLPFLNVNNTAIKRFPLGNVDQKLVDFLKRNKLVSGQFEADNRVYQNTNPRIVYDANPDSLNKSLPHPEDSHYFDNVVYLELNTIDVLKDVPGVRFTDLPAGTFTFVFDIK